MAETVGPLERVENAKASSFLAAHLSWKCGLVLTGEAMASVRFNRWQGLAITQLSVAVALVSGLSIAGLGVGLSFLHNREFAVSGLFRWAFAGSQLLFVGAAFCSCATVLSRLVDFRLTARRVRGKPPLKVFGADPAPFSASTWCLFWTGCTCFFVGASLLVVSVGSVYVHFLWLAG